MKLDDPLGQLFKLSEKFFNDMFNKGWIYYILGGMVVIILYVVFFK